MVKVSITRTEDELYSALSRAIDDTDEKPITTGDHVLWPGRVDNSLTVIETDGKESS